MKGWGKHKIAVVGGLGVLLGALLTLFAVNLVGNTLIPAGFVSPHYQGTAPEEMTEEMIERLSSEIDPGKRPTAVKAMVRWMDSNEVPGVMEEMLERLAFPESLRTWSSLDRHMEATIKAMENDMQSMQGVRESMRAMRTGLEKDFAEAEKNMDCSVKTFDQNRGMVKVCVPKESRPAK